MGQILRSIERISSFHTALLSFVVGMRVMRLPVYYLGYTTGNFSNT